MRIQVRPAQIEELPFLQAKADQRLPEGYEPVDLRKRIVYVADDDGVLAGVAAAGLVWQIEPLILFPEFERYAPPAGKRRAVHDLARIIIRHVREQPCGIPQFFAHLDDPDFEKLATQKKFGLWPAYKAGTVYKGGSR